MKKHKFDVQDTVNYNGLVGVVVGSYPAGVNIIQVKFKDTDTIMEFSDDGYILRHSPPDLKLIKKPKNKFKEIKAYVPIKRHVHYDNCSMFLGHATTDKQNLIKEGYENDEIQELKIKVLIADEGE